jgi:hypothetical protein
MSGSGLIEKVDLVVISTLPHSLRSREADRLDLARHYE